MAAGAGLSLTDRRFRVGAPVAAKGADKGADKGSGKRASGAGGRPAAGAVPAPRVPAE